MTTPMSKAVQDAVRESVLSGKFRPGERLKFADLQDRHGTSIGVIREALLGLVDQGLVEFEHSMGFRVVELSRKDLGELTEARIAIEGLVFPMSIEHGGLDWESQVIASHHRLQRTPRAVDGAISQAWSKAHREFHGALLAGCPNARLLQVALSLRDSAELYVVWSQTLPAQASRDLVAEHQALCDAAVNRDIDAGEELIRSHIKRTAKLLDEALDNEIIPSGGQPRDTSQNPRRTPG
jgi:DNA-binding GntR family transcriptional regulator